LQQAGDFRRARAIFLRANALFTRAHDPIGVVETAQKLGDVHRQLEEFSAAARWYSAALKHLPSQSYDSTKVDLECGLALCHRGEGKYARAITGLKRALHGYTRRHDHEGVAYAQWALGTTQRFAGRFIDAERNLRKSISLYEKLKDTSGLAYARCGLGGTLRMRGHARESEKLYRQANAVFKKLGDRFGQAYSFCGQGNALRMQGRERYGIPFMKKAIALYTSLKQKGPRAFVLWSLAQAEQSLGHEKAAAHHLNQSEKLFRAVNDRRGLTYISLGRRAFRDALRRARNESLPFEAAHALRGLDDKRAFSLYRKCGVNHSAFLRNRALP
jgi:tetratricopeptide (TPR) repeat protein